MKKRCVACGGELEPGVIRARNMEGGVHTGPLMGVVSSVCAFVRPGVPTSANPIKAFLQGLHDEPGSDRSHWRPSVASGVGGWSCTPPKGEPEARPVLHRTRPPDCSESDKYRYAPYCKRSLPRSNLLRFDGIHVAKGWSAALLLILPRCRGCDHLAVALRSPEVAEFPPGSAGRVGSRPVASQRPPEP
jgi:hypothetical protein